MKIDDIERIFVFL